MRFNAEIYEKVFPHKEEVPDIESSVDTFKPTEEKLKAMDHKPGDDAKDPEPTKPEDNPEPTKPEDNPEPTKPEDNPG